MERRIARDEQGLEEVPKSPQKGVIDLRLPGSWAMAAEVKTVSRSLDISTRAAQSHGRVFVLPSSATMSTTFEFGSRLLASTSGHFQAVLATRQGQIQ